MNEDLKYLNIPKEKILSVSAYYTNQGTSYNERWEIIKSNYKHYKIIATGNSYLRHGCYLPAYEMPLMMAGNYSQDLYYDYQFAKRAFELKDNDIRYALIGLAPWIFQVDISIAAGDDWAYLMMGYYSFLHDMHNYEIPIKTIDKVLNLEAVRSLKNGHVQNVDDYPSMWATEYNWSIEGRAKCYQNIKKLLKKDHPKTVEENKEILKKYIALCEEKNIVPIGVFYPMSEIAHKYFKGRVLDEYYCIVNDFIKTTSLKFLNLFKLEGITLDDFCDEMHMNLSGAKKTSEYINNYLMKLEKGEK